MICAEATQSDAPRSQFIHMQHAQQAASLLGLEMEQLTSAVFRKNLSQTVSNNPVRYIKWIYASLSQYFMNDHYIRTKLL